MGTERRKVIIDRSMWLHGHGLGSGETLLLNNFGQKCCLGFAAEQLCGATEAEILDESTPEAVASVFLRGLPELVEKTDLDDLEDRDYSNTDLCECLMQTNDDTHYPDIDSPQREEDIRTRFAAIGVDVEFTGEYHTGTRSSLQQKEAEDDRE